MGFKPRSREAISCNNYNYIIVHKINLVKNCAAMTVPVHQDVVSAIQLFVTSIIFSLLLLPALFVLCCTPCCGITACVCRKRKKNAQSYLDRLVFRTAAHLYWFLKKKKDPNNNSYFVILGRRAPLIYPYYLLMMTLNISLYVFYSFITNSIYTKYGEYDYGQYNNTEFYSECTPTDDCVEIKFVDGIECAITVFSLCAFTFAITTYTLLKCTSCLTKDKSRAFKRCTYPFIFLIQIVLFLSPRALYYYYLIRKNAYSSLLSERNNGNGGGDSTSNSYLDYNSLVALCAILESITMSMLTPWYWFEEVDESNYNVVESNYNVAESTCTCNYNVAESNCNVDESNCNVDERSVAKDSA